MKDAKFWLAYMSTNSWKLTEQPMEEEKIISDYNWKYKSEVLENILTNFMRWEDYKVYICDVKKSVNKNSCMTSLFL